MSYIGEPTVDHTTGCRFALRPGQPRCPLPSTRHVVIHSAAWAHLVSLLTCEIHHPMARATGTVLGDHQLSWACDLAGSIWVPDRDECVVDDSGVEPAHRAREAASA